MERNIPSLAYKQLPGSRPATDIISSLSEYTMEGKADTSSISLSVNGKRRSNINQKEARRFLRPLPFTLKPLAALRASTRWPHILFSRGGGGGGVLQRSGAAPNKQTESAERGASSPLRRHDRRKRRRQRVTADCRRRRRARSRSSVAERASDHRRSLCAGWRGSHTQFLSLTMCDSIFEVNYGHYGPQGQNPIT